CHSALELKLYLNRFVHVISGMHDLSGITFTRYNQYESFIVPWVKWLEGHGVTFVYDTRVTNVLFDITANRKAARRIEWLTAGKRGARDLTENDLVFMTIGSPVENSSWGDQHTPAKFCTEIHDSTQMTATVTFGPGKVADYIQKISQRNPFERDGHFFTGGNLTFRDSAWSISWNGERQPHFKAQRPDEVVSWIIGLFPDKPGNFVQKPMLECTGEEIAQEWLYHMGVPVAEIGNLASSVNCNPCTLPFCVAFFLPRRAGDRP